jgi:hypothetical protein
MSVGVLDVIPAGLAAGDASPLADRRAKRSDLC